MSAQPNELNLQIIAGAERGTIYKISSQGAVVGRKGGGGDLVLDEPSASRKHAKIFYHKDKWVLQDMESRNGTVLNGKKLDSNKAHVIRDGSSIQIGKTLLQVVSGHIDLNKTDVLPPAPSRHNAIHVVAAMFIVFFIIVEFRTFKPPTRAL